MDSKIVSWTPQKSSIPSVFRDADWAAIVLRESSERPILLKIDEDLRSRMGIDTCPLVLSTGEGDSVSDWWMTDAAHYTFLHQFRLVQMHPERSGLTVRFLVEGINRFTISCIFLFSQIYHTFLSIEGVKQVVLHIFTWTQGTKYLTNAFNRCLKTTQNKLPKETIEWESYSCKRDAIAARVRNDPHGFFLAQHGKWAILGMTTRTLSIVETLSHYKNVLVIVPVSNGTSIMVGAAFKRHLSHDCNICVYGLCKTELSSAIRNQRNRKYSWIRTLASLSLDMVIPVNSITVPSDGLDVVSQILINNNIKVPKTGCVKKTGGDKKTGNWDVILFLSILD